eukprot:TRINITY_DN48289_c0_g1_i1.p1 TRINITY_DN48289_c0_g1~~TRINITY_DN48289_c0_g1_i1.p1  ORF type:complete len:673 (+),score=235.31 TRINITY_DN48289_c0_g1_i1:49-2067(+)
MQGSSHAFLATLLLMSLAQADKLHSFDVAAARKSPTTKVMELLKGMKEQLGDDATADEVTYKKFKCWCKDNTEDRTQAAALAKQKLGQVSERIEILSAKLERLTAEIQNTEDQVQANKASLDTATALRENQNERFVSERKRISEDLRVLTDASAQMSSGSFLQARDTQALKPTLQQLMSNHFDKMSSNDREIIQDFLIQDSTAPTGTGNEYVLGVLSGLADSLKEDLAKLSEGGAKDKAAYEELKKGQERQIRAGEEQIISKTAEKAEAKEEQVHKNHELKALTEAADLDVDFVDKVKAQCADTDAQYEERTKLRAEETACLSKAIATLESDETRATLGKAYSFLQDTAVSSSKQRREIASTVLSSAGKKLDARLLVLAMKTKMDDFDQVKKAMDVMVAALKKEQEDDVEQKDYCVKSFHENQLTTEDKSHSKEQFLAKEQSSKSNIDEMEKDLKQLSADVQEMKKQLQLAKQNREAENKELQEVILQQQETRKLLKEAYGVLEDFYSKRKGRGALVQLHVQARNDTTPESFKEYKPNGQSFGVLSMIQQLLAESEATEAEAKFSEKSAQKAYEKISSETTAAIQGDEKAIAMKTSEKAVVEKVHVQAKRSGEGMMAELEELAAINSQLHESCDYLIQNFDTTQQARVAEMESIAKAKAILNGASFSDIQLG